MFHSVLIDVNVPIIMIANLSWEPLLNKYLCPFKYYQSGMTYKNTGYLLHSYSKSHWESGNLLVYLSCLFGLIFLTLLYYGASLLRSPVYVTSKLRENEEEKKTHYKNIRQLA